jgi:hypothetical protein
MSFAYAIRDLYMSFSDAYGNQLSILFDLIDTMSKFISFLVSTQVHVAMHSNSNEQKMISGSLPIPPGSPDDEPVLVSGMTAGTD